MRALAISRLLGLLLLIFSLSSLPPIAVYMWYQEGYVYPFVISFIFTFTLGFLLWFPTRHSHTDLKTRDGFLVVVLIWVVACLFGAIPFYLNFYPHLSFTDALFESVSGLSTTGATVFTHLDDMSHAILYYRQQLTLFGGVGVVVISLSILPVLGVGGMQLYMAETGGPVKTNRLRPRLRQTAKALWLIYLGLVACCALAYWLAGMQPFDAISQSFSAVATAGFSTHDQNLGYYHGHAIQLISIVFMILGSTNFGLHYQFFKQKNFNVYWKDPEFLMYLKILGTISLIAMITLLLYNTYPSNFFKTMTESLFTVTSAVTTTGFEEVNPDQWPTFLPYLLVSLCFIGGCGGSTSGGIKVLRFLLLKQQGERELKRLIHPQGVFSLYLGEQPLPEKIIQGVSGFVAIFMLLLMLTMLGLLAAGLDFRTSFGSALAALSNTGVGLGQTAIIFEGINNPSKWILTLAMFAGRLEILTILVLFTRDYWRK